VVASPDFLPKAPKGEDPVVGLPNASPFELPDPKAEGEEPNEDLAAEPNVVDPDPPNENGVLVVDVSGVLSLDSVFDSLSSAFAVSFFSSTTTHEEFSGTSLATISSGSLGKFSEDPNISAEKKAGSFMC